MILSGTAAAISGRDFIVVGSTRGATMYDMFMLSRRGIKRIFRLYDRILIAYTGLQGDFQYIQNILENYLKRRIYESGREPTVKQVSRILSSILYSYRFYFPNYISAIVAGFDPGSDRPKLFDIGPVGSVIEDKYAASGEGFEIALGVLEAEYREDLSLEEAKRILTLALKASASRNLLNEPSQEPVIEYIHRKPAHKIREFFVISLHVK